MWFSGLFSGAQSMTHSEGMHFVTRRIEEQAESEGAPLGDIEKYMLRFSEEDPGFVIDEARMKEFERTISDDAFEKKITGLIKRAHEIDRSKDRALASKWKAAVRAIRSMDMYILVMLDAAL